MIEPNATGAWSAHQLAEFLARISECSDAAIAQREAAERAAEAFEAEVAVVGETGRPVGWIGFPRTDGVCPVHVSSLLGTPDGIVALPQIGDVATLGASHETPEGHYHLVVGRVAPATFTPEERGLLRSMARVLALSLRSLHLLTEQQKRQDMLLRISQIQQAIAGRAELDEMLHAITRGLGEFLGEIVMVRLVDPDSPTTHHMVASYGVPDDVRPMINSLPIEIGITGRAVQENRLVIINDYQVAERMVPDFVAYGVEAMMAAPIHEAGTAVGAVCVASRTVAFTDLQREALEMFTQTASLALSNAHAVEGMRRAYYDALTGLPNRAFFGDELARRRSEDAGRSAVLFIDIDRFKAVNDSLGHAAGDELLRAVADRVSGCLRPDDVVARHGGDEFTVLLPDVHSDAEVDQVAERIIASLSAPVTVAGREIVVSASVGIALDEPGLDTHDLVQQADVAMYHAKQTGRARHARFSRALGEEARRRLDTEVALRNALTDNELSLHYQPLVDLISGRTIGAEALLRWNAPDQQDTSIADVISLAEDTGLIIPIGEWVIREACAQRQAWAPLIPDDFRLHANVSVKQLEESDFDARLHRCLRDHGLSTSALTLEITESVLIGQDNSAREVVDRIRTLGVDLSLDDFGKGYSSLAYLADLNLQSLKIDRGFIARVAEIGSSAAIVRHIIALTHELGMSVVAEGVETYDQSAILTGLGCDHAQGYFFARPMAASAFTELLSAPATTSEARLVSSSW